MRNRKIKTIISSLVILVPLIFGLVVWNELPETIATHWGIDGVADGWQSKIAVVLQPLIFLVLHFLCVGALYFDKRNILQNPIVVNLIYCLVPALSLLTCFIIYSNALGYEIKVDLIVEIFMGVLFLVLGLVMPKIKQNNFIGIRVKWTLDNEENWTVTHIFGGKVWAVCGFAMILSAIFPSNFSFVVLITAIVVAVIVPIVYSYKYSKK